MGVSRNITIIVYTNIETSYELIQKFLIGFWIKSNSSVVNTFYEDETDNDILPKEIEFDKLEPIFKKREILSKVNIISFSVDTLKEGIILSISNVENTFNDDKMFEIWISPGGANKLKEYERNTYFSYYLNLILPRFKEIGCYPSEIICSDIG
ncbi:MAG: hypothetical protein LKG19_05555 [Saprospiraceae bacterium]|nr:hypothetical protein [Saprospiraceae bacterium]